MGELKELIAAAHVTPTHRFLKNLEDQTRLLRCYTQNIDGMEERLDMSCDLEDNGKASVAPRVVRLHGDLNSLKCTLCKSKYIFSQCDIDCFKGGSAPACPNCCEKDEIRRAMGQRAIAIGLLRPNVVLYNDHHEFGELIAELTAQDIRKRPDLLIVMGTSLKVHGIKHLVKEMAQSVHAVKRGKVVLINRVDLAQSEWANIFDYHIKSDTDDAVIALETLVNKLDTEAAKKRLVRRKPQVSRNETDVTSPQSPFEPIIVDGSMSLATEKEITLIKDHGRVLIKRELVKYDQWWLRLIGSTSKEKRMEVFNLTPRRLAYRLKRFAITYLAPKDASDRNSYIEENLCHMMDCKYCNTLSKLVENRGKTNCKRRSASCK